jgi:hypothetical protein
MMTDPSPLKGADPDDQDIFGNTVLHMVVVTGQLVICMRLLIHEGIRLESQGLRSSVII